MLKISHARRLSHIVLGKGEGIPILMCHGLMGNKNNFNFVGKMINEATNRPVISLDMINHGNARRSDKACYKEMSDYVSLAIDELCDGKASLIGHSMGGRVVMYTALENSPAVSSLIVVDVSPSTSRNESMPTSGGIKRYLQLMHEASVPSTLERAQVRPYLHDLLSPEIPERSVRDFLLTNLALTKGDERFRWKANIEVLLEDFDKLAVFPAFEDIEYLGDTLFISGRKSPYIDWNRDYERINDLFPFATLETIDAGHWVHSDQPNQFVKVCADFLQNAKCSSKI